MDQPRITNYQPADARHGTQHRAARPLEVLVDVAWNSGDRQTLTGWMLAWRETGDGDDRAMTAAYVQITAGPGAQYLAWMPAAAVRPASSP